APFFPASVAHRARSRTGHGPARETPGRALRLAAMGGAVFPHRVLCDVSRWAGGNAANHPDHQMRSQEAPRIGPRTGGIAGSSRTAAGRAGCRRMTSFDRRIERRLYFYVWPSELHPQSGGLVSEWV